MTRHVPLWTTFRCSTHSVLAIKIAAYFKYHWHAESGPLSRIWYLKRMDLEIWARLFNPTVKDTQKWYTYISVTFLSMSLACMNFGVHLLLWQSPWEMIRWGADKKTNFHINMPYWQVNIYHVWQFFPFQPSAQLQWNVLFCSSHVPRPMHLRLLQITKIYQNDDEVLNSNCMLLFISFVYSDH